VRLIVFFQAEAGIRDFHVTGVQTCALPILLKKVFASLREDGISKSDVARELLIQPEELDELTFGLMLTAFNGKSHGNISQNKRRSEERRVGKECRYRWC